MDAINQYGGLWNQLRYQNIRTVGMGEAGAQDVQRGQADSPNAGVDAAVPYQEPERVDAGRRIADLQDVSLSMGTQKDMDFLGRETGLETLDIEQAISDMRKDSVLQEYQYFVGGQAVIVTAGEDGMVIRK